MHNLDTNFRKFHAITKSVLNAQLRFDGNTKFYPNKSQISDLEIIAISLMSESLSISSENCLFTKIKTDYSVQFLNLPSRPRFNIRRRKLQHFIHDICLIIAHQLSDKNETLIIDSIPIPICENPRIIRFTSCKDDPQVQPDRGYHASHKSYYYGFKMQLVISEKGIPMAGNLFPASCHDTHALSYINEVQRTDCKLIADKGYLSTSHQLNFFETLTIKLIAP